MPIHRCNCIGLLLLCDSVSTHTTLSNSIIHNVKPLVYVQDEHHRRTTRPLSCVSMLHVSHDSVCMVFLMEFPLPNLMCFAHALVHQRKSPNDHSSPNCRQLFHDCAISVAGQSGEPSASAEHWSSVSSRTSLRRTSSSECTCLWNSSHSSSLPPDR